MKKTFLLFTVSIFAFLLFSCSSESLEETSPEIAIEDSSLDKQKMALALIDLLADPTFKSNVVQTLTQDHTPGIKLASLLEAHTALADQEAYTSLAAMTTQADIQAKNATHDGTIAIPEVWLQLPANQTKNDADLLVAFAPEGDEKEWTSIQAFTLDKQVVYLDARTAPEVPVLVIETNGYETLKAEIAYMNQELQAAGLQNDRFTAASDFAPIAKAGGLETTKLDKIRLNNDEEPWIAGAAEIYAITSGIKNAGNEPEIKIIPMYYLDDEDEDYYPNQILLFWDDYKYQAANIQLFEKDNDTNYKALVAAITNGVFQIIGVFSAQPWVNVLGQVAAAIIEAMPDEFFVNRDDYVDSFYTIEKNKSYTDYYGAARNARITLTPFFIAEN